MKLCLSFQSQVRKQTNKQTKPTHKQFCVMCTISVPVKHFNSNSISDASVQFDCSVHHLAGHSTWSIIESLSFCHTFLVNQPVCSLANKFTDSQFPFFKFKLLRFSQSQL